eukprot:scaffold87810_cov35-Phaeocystis_antarctica.AAC.1
MQSKQSKPSSAPVNVDRSVNQGHLAGAALVGSLTMCRFALVRKLQPHSTCCGRPTAAGAPRSRVLIDVPPRQASSTWKVTAPLSVAIAVNLGNPFTSSASGTRSVRPSLPGLHSFLRAFRRSPLLLEHGVVQRAGSTPRHTRALCTSAVCLKCSLITAVQATRSRASGTAPAAAAPGSAHDHRSSMPAT